ncbi:MAG: hypothetical protein L6R38_004951 [Xanthoria sp. 2 TBL-2021]|nr:MAG: hypothetical protein L6R38_004951 [Xanthoria sp. 2 TBL-2021]
MRIPVSKAYIRPLQAGIVILVVSNVILTLLWILQCTPVSAARDLQLKERSKCFSRGQLQRVIFAQASACCTVRTVLNFQALPKDFTYGGIPNWYWRLFEVQLGIVAACIPALSPGYKWSRTKIRTYISSHTKSSHTYFSKEQSPVQRIEEEKAARHLRAHPANVYSDPPVILQSGNTSLGNEDLGMPGKFTCGTQRWSISSRSGRLGQRIPWMKKETRVEQGIGQAWKWIYARVSLEKMRQVDEFQAVQIQVGFIAHARNIPVALDVKIVVHA